METFQHDPDDNAVDYKISYNLGGVPITGSSWIVPAGMTLVDSDYGPDWARVWLRGGTPGTRYMITNRYSTSNGPRDRSFYIVVVNK